LSVAVLLISVSEWVHAEKLTLAHVAVKPSQGIFWVAKDSGILAKYGFTADIVLIPGTPRTVQALIAGDLDYAVAGSPAARGLSEENLSTWVDDFREGLRSVLIRMKKRCARSWIKSARRSPRVQPLF
jgi:hypothetical protein